MKNLFMFILILLGSLAFAAAPVVKSAPPKPVAAKPKLVVKRVIPKVPQAICLMDSRKNPRLQAAQLKAGCPKK